MQQESLEASSRNRPPRSYGLIGFGALDFILGSPWPPWLPWLLLASSGSPWLILAPPGSSLLAHLNRLGDPPSCSTFPWVSWPPCAPLSQIYIMPPYISWAGLSIAFEMAAYKNSWAQRWTARGSKEANTHLKSFEII